MVQKFAEEWKQILVATNDRILYHWFHQDVGESGKAGSKTRICKRLMYRIQNAEMERLRKLVVSTSYSVVSEERDERI